MPRQYKVAVFGHDGPEGRTAPYFAYLRDYNPAWPGCCLHLVYANTGRAAKIAAIREHKAVCEAAKGSGT